MCVCVCVCVWERERERISESGREKTGDNINHVHVFQPRHQQRQTVRWGHRQLLVEQSRQTRRFDTKWKLQRKIKIWQFFERESNFLDNSDRSKRHGMIKIGAATDLTLNCFGSKLLADHSLVLDLSFQMPTKTRTDEGGCHVVIKERRHWGLILQSGPAQSKFTLRWNCSVLIGWLKSCDWVLVFQSRVNWGLWDSFGQYSIGLVLETGSPWRIVLICFQASVCHCVFLAIWPRLLGWQLSTVF